ncbi:MAG TPA: DUF58 domain-containing protein [Polyangiaceae bacterium]|nr:DUF58 domain-containing protein [Polyangiaceae bacterium]
MRRDLERLNHVLIPATKSERDRWRNSRLARRARPLLWMITRLTREGRVVLVTVGLAAVFAIDVGRTETHLLVFALASLLLASVLLAPAYRLEGVRVDVRCPRRVTVGEEIAFTLSFRNDGATEHRYVRVERPMLPWDGKWQGAQPTLARLPAGGSASTVVHARFVARGEHHIDRLSAAALLPLWLAQGRSVLTPGGARFVVVPKIARVTSFAVGKNPRHQLGGTASTARTGDATDLLGVRPYRPGDPVRDLHARSWARHGSPMVREYQEEHLSRIGLVVDTDDSAAGDDQLEGALSLAAGVIARLALGEARVDLLLAGDGVHALASERNFGSLDQALDVLAAVKASDAFSADRSIARLGGHLETLSSVVLVFLAWDAARAAFVSAIRARGAACVVLIVGDRTAREPHGTVVALDAITRGEALSL